MVGEGVERRLGQRVHRVGRDEVVDVEHVRVGGVLRAGRGPERALHARARGGKAVPDRAGEDLREARVGGARVGDAGLPAQRRVVRQPPVHLRIDPRDEERGDRGDRREVAPRLEGALEAGDVGARDRLVDGDVEEQRDVDVDALADQPLDRLGRVRRAGHLDHHVGPADRLDEAPRLGDRALRVVLDAGRQLEGDVAVRAAARLVDRAQRVGGAPQVVAGEAYERLVGVAHAGVGEGAQLVVVVRGTGDRLPEDRRVGGQPGDPLAVDQALQLAGIEEAAADEVEPGALALLVQERKRLAHGSGPPRVAGSRLAALVRIVMEIRPCGSASAVRPPVPCRWGEGRASAARHKLQARTRFARPDPAPSPWGEGGGEGEDSRAPFVVGCAPHTPIPDEHALRAARPRHPPSDFFSVGGAASLYSADDERVEVSNGRVR